MPKKLQPVSAGAASATAPSTELREGIALTAILLIALLVRIPGLGESLWFDEVMYTKAAFEQPDILYFLLWQDVHPPFYTMVLVAWTSIFGDSEIAVRLPSLLCGLGSIFLTWRITRRWIGPLQALLVAALLALSPAHIWYSHENKVNMLLLFLALSAVWLYWRAVETGRRRDWINASLVLLLALYTHGYAVPVAAAIFIWLAWRARSDRSLIGPLLASGFFVALVFAPLAVLKFGQGSELERGYLRQLSPGELYKLMLVWLPSGNTLRTVNPYGSFAGLAAQAWPYFLIDAFFAFLLARGLLVFGHKARGGGWIAPVANPAAVEPARLTLLWFAVPVAFTLAGSIFSRHFYIERNLLVVLPPFLLLLAAGADIGRPRWARMAVAAALVGLAVAATVSLLFFKTAVWTVYKYKPDWRAAAHYFDGEIKANGSLRVFITNETNEIFYYQRRIMLADLPAGAKQDLIVADACAAETGDIERTIVRRRWSPFYLVHNATWGGCWDRAWKMFSVAPQFELVEKRQFKGLTVYKFSL